MIIMNKTTKQLARELGFLRKRSSESARREKTIKARQIFSYLIVLDFESTCWQGDKGRPQEIIEFPAVLLNTVTGQIQAEFHFYVQPQENPVLSSFCQELTGIKQEQVDEGIPLSICLKKFSRWLKEISEQYDFVYHISTTETQPRCAFVTWSDWDLGVCLHYETRRKQLRKPPELSAWIDLRATYKTFYARKPKGLNGALQDLGLQFEGREHSGIIDAMNTARLAYKMICDGCVLKITKTLLGAVSNYTAPRRSRTSSKNIVSSKTEASPSCHKVDGSHLTDTNHTNSLIGNIQSSCNVTTMPTCRRTAVNSITLKTVSSSDNNVRNGLSAIAARSLEQTQISDGKNELDMKTALFPQMEGDELGAEKCLNDGAAVRPDTGSKSLSVKGMNDRCLKEHHMSPVNLMGNTKLCRVTNRSELGMKRRHLASPSGTPQNTVVVDSSRSPVAKAKRAQVNGGRPECNSMGSRDRSAAGETITPKTTSGLKDITNANSAFSTAGRKEGCLPGGSLRVQDRTRPKGAAVWTTTGGRAWLNSFKTPSAPLSANNSTKMKRTPPMCSCGHRAKRKIVQKPGPNVGRVFFCCGASGKKSECCTFFKWEPPADVDISPVFGVSNGKPTLAPSRVSHTTVRPLAQPDFTTPRTENRSVKRI